MEDAVVIMENSAVIHNEFLSGKDVVSYVNCALLNVKLQTVSQELKSARQIIAVLQEDNEHFKERTDAK
jgi:hypothetical protein